MKKNGESVNIPRTAHKKDISRVLRLCVIYLLVVSLIVVPVTFSKYVSTVEGNYTGAVFASMDCKLDYDNIIYRFNASGNAQMGIYAFVATFHLTNENSDVSFNYSLSLKLSERTATPDYVNAKKPQSIYFTLNETANKYYTSEDGEKSKETSLSKLTTGLSGNFTNNTLYYAFSDDGKNYTWYTKNSTANAQEFEIATLPNDANDASNLLTMHVGTTVNHYFKVIFFADTRSTKEFEDGLILYKLNYIQID